MATASPAAGSDPVTLTGTVERVVYHDERTRYTVLRLRVPGYDTLLSAVGRTPGVEPGAEVTVTGVWDEHPTHGRPSPGLGRGGLLGVHHVNVAYAAYLLGRVRETRWRRSKLPVWRPAEPSLRCC